MSGMILEEEIGRHSPQLFLIKKSQKTHRLLSFDSKVYVVSVVRHYQAGYFKIKHSFFKNIALSDLDI